MMFLEPLMALIMAVNFAAEGANKFPVSYMIYNKMRALRNFTWRQTKRAGDPELQEKDKAAS